MPEPSSVPPYSHPEYKARPFAAQETDTTLVMSSLRNTVRALRNETTETVQQMERELAGDLRDLIWTRYQVLLHEQCANDRVTHCDIAHSDPPF